LDVVCAFGGWEVIEQFSDALPTSLDDALVGLAQQPFAFGDHLLDGAEIRRVEPAPAKAGGGNACRFEPLANSATLVAAKVVDHDDAPRFQCQDQELFDPTPAIATTDDVGPILLFGKERLI
jgi:hypothetical protein